MFCSSAVTAKPIGCFKDAGLRAMPQLWTESEAMTNALCARICGAEVKASSLSLVYFHTSNSYSTT